MSSFKSRKDAEETIKSCLFEIKEILNRDLEFANIRNRSVLTWLSEFGKSIDHLSTKRLLQKLEITKHEAEAFILSNLKKERRNLIGNDLEETWVQ